jgi:hypothetical protein
VALAPSSTATTIACRTGDHSYQDRAFGGTVLIYGEEPFTECYALEYGERGGGDVALTRII